jgi:hypothetical protein
MKRYTRLLSASFILATFMAAVATGQSAGPQPKTAKPAPPDRTIPYGDPKTPQPDLGTVKDSFYTNDFFNLRIPVPAGWNVHDEASKRRIMQSGNEELSSAKPEMAKGLDNSVQRTLNLLAFDNLNVASTDTGSAALLVGAERIPAGHTLNTQQYMDTTKRVVMSVPGYEVVDDIHTENIGGIECGVMTLKRVMPNASMKQRYIGFVRKGYAIFLVTAYTNETAGRTLDDLIAKSKFN